MPTVSVLIPTFNRAALLAECLRSVLAQTRAPDEVFVIDDGSTDGTCDMVRSNFRGVVTYLPKPNGGKSAALNFALPRVTGEYVWVFDDDDVALPRSIELRLALLQSAPDAGMVVSNHVWGYTAGDDQHIRAGESHAWPAIDGEGFWFPFLTSCFVTIQGTLFRTAALRAAGPFREDLLTSEDYDMLIRVARASHVATLDEPTFIFRRHSGIRGPANARYGEHERERKFAINDRKVGETLRSKLPLSDFAPNRHIPAPGSLDERLALVRRMLVMASKGLASSVIADAEKACSLHPSVRWTDIELETAQRAVQQRYFVVLCADRTECDFAALAAPLAASAAGRRLLRVFARGLIGTARWGVANWNERYRCLRLATRLARLAALSRAAFVATDSVR